MLSVAEIIAIKNYMVERCLNKTSLSELEKDTIDVINELLKKPFDIKTANAKATIIGIKYPDIQTIIATFPQTTVKPVSEITEQDVKYILNCQLKFLNAKVLQTK